MPPQLPQRTSGFRSRAINALIDYVRAITPLPSSTIKHEWRSDGVLSRADVNTDVQLEDQHFRIELKPTEANGTAVRVHSGNVIRKWGSAATSAPMTVDAGTAGMYSGYKDLTGITTTKFIMLTLTAETAAASAAVSTSDTNTELTDNTFCIFCLGKVTCANGVIESIEQYRLGDIHAPWNLASMNGSYQKGGSAQAMDSFSITGSGDTVTLHAKIHTVTVADGRVVFADGVETDSSATVTTTNQANTANTAGFATNAGSLTNDGTSTGAPLVGVTGVFFGGDGAGGTVRIGVTRGLITSIG